MPSEQNAEVRARYEAVVASLAPTDDHTPGIPDFRAAYEDLCAKIEPPTNSEYEETELGGVPVISCLHNSSMGDAAILYFHGGGYAIGSAGGYKAFGTALSKASSSKVFLVDYRLAPEHPYPAALDDAVAAYKALLDEGLQETDITIAGDSAGGGLCAALLLALKADGTDLPAGAVLYSPLTDFSGDSATLVSNAEKDPIVSSAMLDMLGPLYIGDNDPKDPLISPLFGDLSGLPPLLVFVGTEETLHDDSVSFVEKAKDAGVDAELVIGDGMYHIYPCFQSVIPEADEAVDRSGRFIAEMTNTPTIT